MPRPRSNPAKATKAIEPARKPRAKERPPKGARKPPAGRARVGSLPARRAQSAARALGRVSRSQMVLLDGAASMTRQWPSPGSMAPHLPAADRQPNRAFGRPGDLPVPVQGACVPGSSTTPGRPSARVGALGHIAFHYTDSVGTRNPFSIAAQWLACTFPCRRFADILTDACARLGADVGRYSFIVVDLHHLLLAGLPAHLCENAGSIRRRTTKASNWRSWRIIHAQAASFSSQSCARMTCTMVFAQPRPSGNSVASTSNAPVGMKVVSKCERTTRLPCQLDLPVRGAKSPKRRQEG